MYSLADPVVYGDGRDRSLPPWQPGGDQLLAAGRMEGNDETESDLFHSLAFPLHSILQRVLLIMYFVASEFLSILFLTADHNLSSMCGLHYLKG